MKQNPLTFILFSLFVLGSTLKGDIRFPSGSYEIGTLTEAKAAAEKKKVPIAFVMTNKDTTCSLCQSATSAIIQEFRSSAVIVYLKDFEKVPQNVTAALTSKGNFIPKVTLFSADLSQGYGVVTYEEIKAEGDRPLRGLKKAAKQDKDKSRE